MQEKFGQPNLGQKESLSPQEAERLRGAKFLERFNLHKMGFGETVEHTFQRARAKKGELYPGRAGERRAYAYLKSLDDRIARRGEHLEKVLWEKSIERLVIRPEDIEDNFWREQQQIYYERYGREMELSDETKANLTNQIQQKQRNSLNPWAEFLSDRENHYPMWFKIYVWVGLASMSDVYDGETHLYHKRDSNTVAPYPNLNTEALNKVFKAVNDFYGITEDAEKTSDEKEIQRIEVTFETENTFEEENSLEENQADDAANARMTTLIQSGNFRKLYSRMLEESKIIVPVPEKAEDVHGEWIILGKGDEEKIAQLSECTPWCTENLNTVQNYLDHGTAYDNGPDMEKQENEAQFAIFCLKDPETGRLSDQGCIAIRTGVDGIVGDVCGLVGAHQGLNEALIPEAEAYVNELKGGKRYLRAIEDVKRLVALGKKFDQGEPFNEDDLKFIFEVDRPIEPLSTFAYDPRIAKYRDIKKLLENQTDVDAIVEWASPIAQVENLSFLMQRNAKINVDALALQLKDTQVARHLDTLIHYGAEIDVKKLAERMMPDDVADNLAPLMRHGAEIDVNKLVQNVSSAIAIVENLQEFLRYDAEIDYNKLLSELKEIGEVPDFFEELVEYAGLDPEDLLKYIEPGARTVIDNMETMVRYLPAAKVAEVMFVEDLVDNFGELKNAGFTEEDLLSRFQPDELLHYYDSLTKNGAQITPEMLLEMLDREPTYIDKGIVKDMIKHGVSPNELMSRMDVDEMIDSLDILVAHQVKLEDVLWRMRPIDVADNLKTLMEHGADANDLMMRLDEFDLEYKKDELIELGADQEKLQGLLKTYAYPEELAEWEEKIDLDEVPEGWGEEPDLGEDSKNWWSDE